MMRFVAILALAAVLGAESHARLRNPVETKKAQLEAKIKSLEAKIASADTAIKSTKTEIAQTVTAVQGAHDKVASPSLAVTKVNVTTKVNRTKANLTDAQKLERLETGLDSINKLRAIFTAKEEGPPDGAEKFANGAMSEELSKKDSAVWSMITSMISATKETTKTMQGKNKTAQAAMMASLEANLNQKAVDMTKITDQVNEKQEMQNEEYMLGLLILHKTNWNMTQQVKAVERLSSGSPLLSELLKKHDDKKPLADQLAVLMDKKSKKATKAAKMFIQLASSLN
jgi:hypothetical protein